MVNEPRPIVFLASPIDSGGQGIVSSLRHAVRTQLDRHEITYFDPSHAWHVAGTPRRELEQVNWAALGRVDGVLAIVTDQDQSLGVPMEIERASHSFGMPVAVIGGERALASWALVARQRARVFWPEHIEAAVKWLGYQIALDGDQQQRRRQRKVLRTEDNIRLPVHDGDAGLDLVVSEGMFIEPGGRSNVPCGAGVALPDGMWGMIVGRSSTWGRGLSVDTRIIDAGYRGPLYANVHNISDLPVYVEAGERIVQLVPFHSNTHNMVLEQVDTLPPSERGQRGHGSSGR